KDYDRAFDHLSRAVMLNPRSWKAQTAFARVCVELDATDMAALAIEQARAIKPRDANVLVTLAEIDFKEREFERAKEAYREPWAFDQDLYPAIMGLGNVCQLLGQHAEAVQAFESLIKRGMSTLEVVFAFTSVPLVFVNIDLLAELDKLSRDPADERQFEEHAGFIRATAADKAGRHAEAWQHLARVNHAIFLSRQEYFRDSLERQRAALTLLQRSPIKAVGDNRDSRQPISL